MSTPLRRFSVFLLPTAADAAWAEGVIRELAGRYDLPSFAPHLTVCSGSYTDVAELQPLMDALAAAAARLAPFDLVINGIGTSAEYFRSLFIEFADSPELAGLHAAAWGALDRQPADEFRPHLSLLYAELPLAEKQQAARTVILDRQRLSFDELRIVVPDPAAGWGDPRHWQSLFHARLGQTAGRVRAVLFDFGGVLAEEGFREGLFALAHRQGLDPLAVHGAGMEAIYRTGYVVGRGSEAEFWRVLRQQSGLRGDDAALTATILDRFVLRPRLLAMVRSLRAQGYRVAILSDQTDWLEELDRRFGFYREFDRVFSSYRLGKGKRDPSLFDEVVGELGLTPNEVLFIDDMLANVVRAESRGLRGILFESEEQCLAELAKRFGRQREGA